MPFALLQHAYLFAMIAFALLVVIGLANGLFPRFQRLRFKSLDRPEIMFWIFEGLIIGGVFLTLVGKAIAL